MRILNNSRGEKAIALLNVQYELFQKSEKFAAETKHPIPMDTRSWSQILVSLLTGVDGAGQKKGADFADGSDVKAANCWRAIDTPRFNGVIKAGTKAKSAGSLASLEKMPHLYFVLWDESPTTQRPRCRIWAVRPQKDKEFRAISHSWYKKAESGEIKSTNFQIHPPRNIDSNILRNACGNLEYPLFFCAERSGKGFEVLVHNADVLETGECVKSREIPKEAAREKRST